MPASAILHLHDRDWVYIPARTTSSAGRWWSEEISAGKYAGGRIRLAAGQQVVINPLPLQNTIDNQ